MIFLPIMALHYSSIWSAVAAVSAIALALGLCITLVFRLFAVASDEKEKELLQCLPGVNCGGCGYSGCLAYAQALASGTEQAATLCAPGGQDTADALAACLGQAPAKFLPTVALVHCQGTYQNTRKRFQYSGSPGCATAQGLFSGPGSCAYGCLGFADCVRACEYDAIHIVDGVARVDTSQCIACGQCVKACPRQLISIEVKYEDICLVRCSNPLAGPQAKASCDIACIGCGVCVRKCPAQAIALQAKLAVIDQAKCTHCGLCATVCPTHAIVRGLEIE